MNTVKVDFKNIYDKVKCINAVNNGPSGSRVNMTGNFESYEKRVKIRPSESR